LGGERGLLDSPPDPPAAANGGRAAPVVQLSAIRTERHPTGPEHRAPTRRDRAPRDRPASPPLCRRFFGHDHTFVLSSCQAQRQTQIILRNT
jgi:hypothetical protein